MANGHGGARTGAGRKPKAVRYPEISKQIDEQIIARMPDIVDMLIQRATDHGDTGAARYLLDRVLGKFPAAEVDAEETKDEV